MPLYSERQTAESYAAREAAGEDLWAEALSEQLRMKIAELWEKFENMSNDVLDFREKAAQPLRVAGISRASTISFDWILGKGSDSDTAFNLDLIECFRFAVAEDPRVKGHLDLVDSILNGFFATHRVAFRLVDGEFVPFKSDELHREVIEPVIRLLVDKRFEKAQTAYLNAVREIAVDPADAITDAGTALQETLEALGCSGNALGALISDASKKGHLGKHDTALTAGIEKFLVWAAANRNNMGDGHHVTDATRADAWLMVHIVGSLIVRLADHPGEPPDLRPRPFGELTDGG